MSLLNAAQLLLGGYQTIAGLSGFNSLGEYPKPTISKELQGSYNRAEDMSRFGYSPEETAAFKGNLASQSEARYKRATDQAGGSLSQAIQSGINYGNIKGLLNFAGNDASFHRRNIQYADSIGRQIQSQKNLITQSEQQRYNKVENAYGNEFTKGSENIVNPFNLTQAMNYISGQKELDTNNTGDGMGGIGVNNSYKNFNNNFGGIDMNSTDTSSNLYGNYWKGHWGNFKSR